MNSDTLAAGGTTERRCICTACALLCDDIPLGAAGPTPDCERAARAFARIDPDTIRSAACAWEDGAPLHRDEALARAATRLRKGRRVLVTGLVDATLEAILVACDLAERLGAAVDPGREDPIGGPTVARIGSVTAEWEEVRDRADLVVFWWCDPAASHPRFISRFVAPRLADGRTRRTISLGPHPVLPPSPLHVHLPLAAGLQVEAARILEFGLNDSTAVAADAATLQGSLAELVALVNAASCSAWIGGGTGGGGSTLEEWSFARLLRAMAHRRTAFAVPLQDAGVNATGCAAVCTWRYGAPGAIARADRLGGRFLPGEASALKLVGRGEVDVVLAVGALEPALDEALAKAADRIATIRIAAGLRGRRSTGNRAIELACADTLTTSGTMLRGDGRHVRLVPGRQSTSPSMQALLTALLQAVDVASDRVLAGDER